MAMAKPTKSTEQRTIQRFGYFRPSYDLNDLVVQQKERHGERRKENSIAPSLLYFPHIVAPFPLSPPHPKLMSIFFCIQRWEEGSVCEVNRMEEKERLSQRNQSLFFYSIPSHVSLFLSLSSHSLLHHQTLLILSTRHIHKQHQKLICSPRTTQRRRRTCSSRHGIPLRRHCISVLNLRMCHHQVMSLGCLQLSHAIRAHRCLFVFGFMFHAVNMLART